MSLRCSVLLLAGSLFVTAPLRGLADSPTPIEVSRCLVQLHETVDVPARVAGVLTRLRLVEGQSVERGSELARVDDRSAQNNAAISTIRWKQAENLAKNEIRITYARAVAAVADSKYRRTKTAHDRGAVTAAEVEESGLERRRSLLAIEQAQADREDAAMTARLRGAELAAAKELVDRHRIVTPLTGNIVELKKRAGEWVDPGDCIARVARMDALRVEGFVPVSQATPRELTGRPVTVQVRLARGRVESFRGTLIFVNPIVQPGGHYRVRALVQNRRDRGFWLMQPGMTAVMQIDAASPRSCHQNGSDSRSKSVIQRSST